MTNEDGMCNISGITFKRILSLFVTLNRHSSLGGNEGVAARLLLSLFVGVRLMRRNPHLNHSLPLTTVSVNATFRGIMYIYKITAMPSFHETTKGPQQLFL